jgi:uncharacterized membrane protein YgcG
LTSSQTPTRYEVDPHLHAPYLIQSALGLEQQVAKNTTLSVTYLNAHGAHQLFANDINAPIYGTYPLGEPGLGTYPYGSSAGNIYDYQSGGLFNQNQLITNFNMHLRNNFSLTGYYTLGYANANTTGNGAGLIMNPYDIRQDYGRASFDVRNSVFLFGTWNLPHRFSLYPILIATSGRPLNVTLDDDLFGIGGAFYNARPALAPAGTTCPQPSGSSLVCTSLGIFNTAPTSAQAIIPPNGYDNPGQFNFNLRLSKTIGFGRAAQGRSSGGDGGGFGGGRGGRGGGGGLRGGLTGSSGGGMFGGQSTNKRFNLTFSVTARNVFNIVNLGPRIGAIGSPLFNRSDSLGGVFGGGPGGLTQAANRRIDLQVTFTF